ncbi:MAG: glycosyltransferase family 2 protein [Acidobacteriota bacterium]|nr:glycosyltransferase family 2 protein [Acidobacteriota bacterium]
MSPPGAPAAEAFAGRLPPDTTCELSIVMPCLNEADTIATCIRKARLALNSAGIDGEIIVADNGSTDGSREIASELGARVIEVARRGYGEALRAGIAAARGPFILMGDADDSYDFAELPPFLEKLREGADLVQGCRLPSGGGRVMPGAMPASHRWIGNPLFTWLARRWFWSPVHDVYCGLRAFRKDYYESLHQRCGGMEFATEMIIKASLDRHARIAEVPITLHPDGRTSHPPHLRTFRDGWRTLRFFLLLTPRNTFLMPGLILITLGVLGYALALPGIRLGGIRFDAHTLVFASLAILLGYQAALFAVFAKVTGIAGGLLPRDVRLERWLLRMPLERTLLLGLALLCAGGGLLMAGLGQWWAVEFGNLDYARTMRWILPGATLTALGFQTMLAGLFACVLGLAQA